MPSGRTEAVYPTDLPVRACLPDLAAALDAAGSAVLVAPPGSGKTTLVPLALAGILPLTRIHPLTGGPSGPGLAGPGLAGPPGRIVVAEPRRVAARAAARRMAQLLGETVGGRIGLTVRGDRRVSASTVVEVVTTGVLVQRLQRDPELPGVGTVVLDECHERHLDADLALALTVDARSGLRPDLRLLATSATLDAASVAEALGSWADCPAPVVTASGDELDRASLRAVQTPQGFDRALLLEAHEAALAAGATATDDAALVRRLGRRVALVEGSPLLIKVTRPDDLLLAEALARRLTAPTGTG